METFKITCPLCSAEMDVYSSPKYRMFEHIVEEHIEERHYPVGIVTCVCNEKFRGPDSLARHFMRLTEKQRDQHSAVFTMAAGASLEYSQPKSRVGVQRNNRHGMHYPA